MTSPLKTVYSRTIFLPETIFLFPVRYIIKEKEQVSYNAMD